METRGRKSGASLGVVVSLPGQRPEPPDHLTEDQANRWRAITATKPADWFLADTAPLLERYVVEESTAKMVQQQLAEFRSEWLLTDDGLKRFQQLTSVHQKSAAVLCSLATKMRISQQSRYDAKQAATAANKGGGGTAKPWERRDA